MAMANDIPTPSTGVISNDEVVDVLNDLLENARDGEYGFRASAERSTPQLKQVFSRACRALPRRRRRTVAADPRVWRQSRPKAAPPAARCTAGG